MGHRKSLQGSEYSKVALNTGATSGGGFVKKVMVAYNFIMSDLGDIRRDFNQGGLERADLLDDPIQQFKLWLNQAIKAQIPDPTAMTLATATLDGTPSARIVLLKDMDHQGLCFYTNYESRKGQQLAQNPQAALVFFWPAMDRQVRFEGVIGKVSAQQSQAYFHSRPLGSQISAWASDQSKPVASREELEDKAQKMTEQAQRSALELPPFWGGYRLVPNRAEFWCGRPSRLHDRFEYARQDDGCWVIQRLNP